MFDPSVYLQGFGLNMSVASLSKIVKKMMPSFEKASSVEYTYKNEVLVLGLGRTGKTSLIHWITNSRGTNHAPTTSTIQIHDNLIQGINGEIHRVFVLDYEGQDLGLLTSALNKMYADENCLPQHGSIDSMILVVDLFEDVLGGREVKTYKDINEDRVKEHIVEWSKNTINGMSGFIDDVNLKYVCLFINKLDLWELRGQINSIELLREKFHPIINTFEKRLVDQRVVFNVIAGSAHTGENILSSDGILQKMLQFSQPVN